MCVCYMEDVYQDHHISVFMLGGLGDFKITTTKKKSVLLK